VVSGAYRSSYTDKNLLDNVAKRVQSFEKKHGRRPRILVAKMGQDGHDRGAKVIASGLADLGFDVDVGPLFATPEEVAQQALDADVHIVGVSSQAGHSLLHCLILLLCLKRGEGGRGVNVKLFFKKFLFFFNSWTFDVTSRTDQKFKGLVCCCFFFCVLKIIETGGESILVVAGGVIPPKDYQALYDAGVTAIFGPGTVITKAAIDLVDAVDKKSL
ncbi:hypothetical protein RFI_13192, partial [Reticulomyxa filosa]